MLFILIHGYKFLPHMELLAWEMSYLEDFMKFGDGEMVLIILCINAGDVCGLLQVNSIFLAYSIFVEAVLAFSLYCAEWA